MTCRYCGTALPDGALFCGECGQPVSTVDAKTQNPASSVTVPTEGSAWNSRGFSIADLAFSSPGDTSEPDDDDRDLPDGSPLDPTGPAIAGSAAHCPQCGEPMADGDVFCGECGFVVRNVAAPAGAGADPVTTSLVVLPDLISLGEFPLDPELPAAEAEPESDSDGHDADATTEVEPLIVAELDGADGPAGADGPDGADEPTDVDGPDDAGPEDVPSIDDLVMAPAHSSNSASALATDDSDLEFDEPLPFAVPVGKAGLSPRSRPIPDPFPWGTDRPLREDIEATRLIADSESGKRYVLQFSTGESVTVAGSGLVGRNPSMQPGEYVDQLVPIFDASKSVSKTHLEFGQEAGRFWVSDRYSTNGSVIRQPDAEPRRCDAGRRYFIARGTRVDIGEQFFVVS